VSRSDPSPPSGRPAPAKVYVEPANACNLSCATCVRHAWDEPEGFMDWAAFEAAADGVAAGGLWARGVVRCA
jgi:hypothetical protein